jgi:hypothetical protein
VLIDKIQQEDMLNRVFNIIKQRPSGRTVVPCEIDVNYELLKELFMKKYSIQSNLIFYSILSRKIIQENEFIIIFDDLKQNWAEIAFFTETDDDLIYYYSRYFGHKYMKIVLE